VQSFGTVVDGSWVAPLAVPASNWVRAAALGVRSADPSSHATLRGMPNPGERYRCGERISTGFVESAANQVIAKRFLKKQQMRWTPRGAHLLLQDRSRC
jgi:hypothetical protein